MDPGVGDRELLISSLELTRLDEVECEESDDVIDSESDEDEDDEESVDEEVKGEEDRQPEQLLPPRVGDRKLDSKSLATPLSWPTLWWEKSGEVWPLLEGVPPVTASSKSATVVALLSRRPKTNRRLSTFALDGTAGLGGGEASLSFVDVVDLGAAAFRS